MEVVYRTEPEGRVVKQDCTLPNTVTVREAGGHLLQSETNTQMSVRVINN